MYRGPARAQRDHTDEECESQQDLVFGTQAEFDRLVERDRNYGDRRDGQTNSCERRPQCKVQAGLVPKETGATSPGGGSQGV
jgi:hypothetical protein